MITPFAHDDYKTYLREVLSAGARGSKAALADAAGCQRSFLSQVFHGNVHLTLEHTVAIARHLRLDEMETDYFYCLVARARSATSALTAHYRDKMAQLKSRRENLAQRLDHAHQAMNESDVSEYYSHWQYAALHIAGTIPALRSALQMSKRTGIAPAETEAYLRKLQSWGLLVENKREWSATQRLMHLPRGHFMTLTNHRNWRVQNLELAERQPKQGVHYTAVYSMSRADFAALKEMTIEFLNRSRALVASSVEEELVSFTLDCARF